MWSGRAHVVPADAHPDDHPDAGARAVGVPAVSARQRAARGPVHLRGVAVITAGDPAALAITTSCLVALRLNEHLASALLPLVGKKYTPALRELVERGIFRAFISVEREFDLSPCAIYASDVAEGALRRYRVTAPWLSEPTEITLS